MPKPRIESRLVLAGLVVSLCTGASFLPAEPLELKASSGEIVTLDLAPVESDGSIEGAFRFTKLDSDGRWAPSAFVGFRDEARDGKFRIFLYQTNAGGQMAAGYDYAFENQLVKRKILMNDLPRSAAVRVQLTWDAAGNFHVSLFGKKHHTIKTHLRSMVPFVAVSSGHAKFSFLFAGTPVLNSWRDLAAVAH